MGDYTTVKGSDTTTCKVSTLSGNECVTYGKTVTSDMGASSGSLSDIVDGNEKSGLLIMQINQITDDNG